MGNVTIANVKKRLAGGRRVVECDVTFSASYATNGDSFVAADVATLSNALGGPNAAATLALIETVIAELGPAGHTVFIDRANNKIKAFNGTTEIANTTNLAAVVVHVELLGPGVTG